MIVCDGTCAGTELGDCSHAVNAVPQQERPSLWRRLLAVFRDEPLPSLLPKALPIVHEDQAYVVVTLDTETREVLRVGIYSCSAMSLTMASRHECHLDGPHSGGEDFTDARQRLLTALQTISFYKWMFDKLPAQDREDATRCICGRPAQSCDLVCYCGRQGTI